jgi:metal-responsive CopG/Arc/MetJ family transcriptional regulator
MGREYVIFNIEKELADKVEKHASTIHEDESDIVNKAIKMYIEYIEKERE